MRIKNYLNESSLGRVWSFVEDDSKSFAVISAFRGEYSKLENENRHKDLKRMVKDLNLGYIEMRGGYREDIGFVSEKSLFIPNINKKKAIEIGKSFNQDGILYKDSKGFYELGTSKKTGIGKINANFIKSSGKFNISQSKEIIKNFFSSLMKGSHAGKKFVFRLQEKEYVGHLGRMSGNKPNWITIYEN